jgi:hypothetical protein
MAAEVRRAAMLKFVTCDSRRRVGKATI